MGGRAVVQFIANAVFVIIKPFALSLSKGYSGSTSSPRTASFYCALAIVGRNKPAQDYLSLLKDIAGRAFPTKHEGLSETTVFAYAQTGLFRPTADVTHDKIAIKYLFMR